MKGVFFVAALTSVTAVVLICVFLFSGGVPAMGEIGVLDFLFGQTWAPQNSPASYGIFPMIVGSVYITLGAVIIGVPIGILTAVFLARFCPKSIYKVLKPAVDLLAGIPSIVYGFFGLVVVVPFIRSTFGGNGSSILAASLILGIMILPTIIGVSESAIRAVPDSYYEGALALGATRERSVFRAVLPRQSQALWRGLSSASAAPSAKRWPSCSSRETRRGFPAASWTAFARLRRILCWRWGTRQACTGKRSLRPRSCCSRLS